MTRTLGVVMDSIESINPYKDTTLLLLLAAQNRGWEIMYMQQHDLSLENENPVASMSQLRVKDHQTDWFSLGQPKLTSLSDLNVILMRKDPPFDTEYIYTTYILEAAEKLGVMVLNKPQSLRGCNEKIFAASFPQCTPPLLVSRDIWNSLIRDKTHVRRCVRLPNINVMFSKQFSRARKQGFTADNASFQTG